MYFLEKLAFFYKNNFTQAFLEITYETFIMAIQHTTEINRQCFIEYNIQFLFYFKAKNMAQYSAQILKTLSDQVQNLTPLRESFRHLQGYYSKLTNEFNDLLKFGDRSQLELLNKLKYLQEVHRQLEHEFLVCGQQLREAECEQAKLMMERNQQVAQSEALKSRQQLQIKQKTEFQSKRKDLLEYSSKLQFNIAKYKELIHNIQLAIKSKEYENLDIEREIKKMELVNSKITQLNKETEQNIDQTQEKNEQIVQELHELDDKLNSYSKLIASKEKLNKQSVQIMITKTEQLQQLRNRKEYIEKLIETEDNSQRELLKSYGELESILNVKRQKLQLIQQQNHEYEVAIAEEKLQKSKNKDELERLTQYLQTLVQTNEILFRELERSCTEDRQVQVMLNEKMEKLMLVNDKITETELLSKFDLNSLHHKRLTKNANTSSFQTIKKQSQAFEKFAKTSTTPVARKNLEAQIQERIARSREHQMASTWGSFTKQNYRFDI